MSNHLAIATVTATLRRTLQAFIQEEVPAATAESIRPDSNSGLPNPGVNIYLYQVSPNVAWRGADLPTRDRAGRVVARPGTALDLHYLLTFYGDEGQLLPQRILGAVVRTLHARPYLTRESIRSTIQDPVFGFLADSDLADAVELVKFTPVPHSLEELSKLWSVLLQTPYTLSMAYLGTMVLIEADETPRRALPVRVRTVVASPFTRPVVESVVEEDDADGPIEMGDTVVVRGSDLGGAVDRVRVGVADLPPVPDSVTPTELRVALTDPSLRAGVQSVQVVYENGSETNAAAMVLRPLVTVDGPGVTASEVPIGFDPPVGREQRVVLHLNELGAPPDRDPHAYSFEAPSDNGITDPTVRETTAITFAISNVEPATYLVRVQVSGAENVLQVDEDGSSPTFGFYVGPTASVPA